MSRFFTAIILLLVAGSAFAQVMPADLSTLTGAFVPPPTDYSVAYLSQIFGTVGNVLSGTTGQILGKLFEIFNKGVLIVAAIWLGYIVVTVVLRASQEGSFIGQNKNVPVLLLRIAIGFSLIIPSPSTGYSLLQDIFMKIVVAGVGLADQTWDMALHYLSAGGSIFINPNTEIKKLDFTKILSNAVGSANTPQAKNMPVTQVFQDEVCMKKSGHWAPKQSTSTPSEQSSVVALSYSGLLKSYHPVFDQTNNSVYFPGVGNPANSSLSITKANATCGYITGVGGKFSDVRAFAKTHNLSEQQVQAMKSSSWSGVRQLAVSLLPAAEQYVRQEKNSTAIPQIELAGVYAKTTFAGLMAYTNLISPYARVQLQKAQSGQMNFMKNAKRDGWIAAGRFYWDVEQVNANLSAVSVYRLFPAEYNGDLTQSGSPLPKKYRSHSILTSATTLMTNKITPYMGILWNDYATGQTNDFKTLAVPSTLKEDSGDGFIDTLLNNTVGLFTKYLSGAFTATQFNPIVVLMHLGGRILELVLGIWIGAAVTSFAIGLGAGICASTSPLPTAFRAGLTWIKSLIVSICTLLWVPGIALAYYLPLYPYMVYLLAALGWMMLVVEGMAAAPLVCVGLTHPDGHDFLGKAEQALMLFLGIFLRPALMVIGLIVGMLLSFVAFKFVIVSYAGIVSSLGLTGSQNFAMELIGPPIIFFTLAILVYEVTQQSYNMIFKLPNNIMSWIGAPGQGEDYSAKVSAIASRGAGGAGQAGQAMQQAGGGAEEIGQKTGAKIKGAVTGGKESKLTRKGDK